MRKTENRSIYIIISKTHTNFAKVIRTFGKVRYNHASVCLDRELKEIYSFGRQKHKALFTGKLVRENVSRFTLNKASNVDITIFKIPVSDEQYYNVKEIIETVYNDREYMYNLFSVLTYPLTGGISVYKAFTCIEFIMFLLVKCGYSFDRPLYEYKPDDLLGILSEHIFYQGNMLDCVKEKSVITDYFDDMSLNEYRESAVCLSKLVTRTVMMKKNNLY